MGFHLGLLEDWTYISKLGDLGCVRGAHKLVAALGMNGKSIFEAMGGGIYIITA